MKRSYELVTIHRPDLRDEEVAEERNRIVSAIVERGGEVTKVDPWGKRRLAYEINKFREGIYTVFEFTAPPKAAYELEHVIRLNESIIRHLIVRTDED
ncbi:30S ribosomal protein S6 [Brockia lithotrophica]|uniref:Small ribosomal subunit protein bS6 n=1 Tax=Brockia lithotrophica TaxID=933949 RepID=A0A660KWJ1_9BACL|nr:30S ribosomal protein S6 [Brockia lithotrophica]RKQ83892.1 SSU ribosomal protein S6P [Brockia lithotrophica]